MSYMYEYTRLTRMLHRADKNEDCTTIDPWVERGYQTVFQFGYHDKSTANLFVSPEGAYEVLTRPHAKGLRLAEVLGTDLPNFDEGRLELWLGLCSWEAKWSKREDAEDEVLVSRHG